MSMTENDRSSQNSVEKHHYHKHHHHRHHHMRPGRKYEMREAFAKLSKEVGQELADRYANSARAISNGENVPVNDVKQLQKKKHVLWW